MNIRDIAKKSGVSIATVSRVINNSPKVSGETRETVLHAIMEADYVPNSRGDGVGRNAMRLVGVLVADISNLYYAKAVSLLEKGFRANGFDVLLMCTGRELKNKKAALDSLLQKRVDAVFLVGSAYREERSNTHIRDMASHMPVFLINAYIDIPGVYCIYCDEREAMANTVKYLYEKGKRSILYIHDTDKWRFAGVHKLQGYKDGLAACGLALDPDLILLSPSDMDGAQECVAGHRADFDAVIASEDILAVGAAKAARGVPVIGFNNSVLAACCTPELTSVDNMLGIICPMAVDMLAKHFGGERIPAKVAISACICER
ncbi:MAG: LacI family transcriptional regulator [Lachnospiraceae bacterium]|jgi:LacI family transcriptional regulator/LacI family asc operon transcriptional repressor|nr:LacI family transcriptional regulator [Lachnospiraceae bacterium]